MAAELEWEQIESEMYTARAKVPGGWFVSVHAESGITMFFYPDARHTWDGGSLPAA